MSSNPQSRPQAVTHYYPTEKDFESPAKMRAVLQQVLKQHYELVDRHEELKAQVAIQAQTPPPPQPNGPTNTLLLGLPVTPIDALSLTNGATLKWDKASGSFKFS